MVRLTLFAKSIPSAHPARLVVLGLLILGAFTPLYEINRSLYRTFSFYYPSVCGLSCPYASKLKRLPIVADEYGSIVRAPKLQNFIGEETKTLFRFIAKQ